MLHLINKLKKLLNTPTAMEAYIASKNPSSPAEVEFWLRHYDQQRYGGLV